MSVSVQRLFDIAATALFAVLILIPGGGMLLDASPHIDATEKRTAVPWPGRPASADEWRSFPRNVEAWFADRFLFRSELIRGHGYLSFFGLGVSPSPRVIIGKDGWLFLDAIHEDVRVDSVADYRGTRPLSPARLEWWRWLAADMQYWSRSQGMDFLFVMVPPKMDMNPDKVPDDLQPRGNPTTFEQVRDHLAPTLGNDLLDLTPVLESYRPAFDLYLKTDTHWTWPAGFESYRSIMHALELPQFDTTPMSRDDFHIVTNFWAEGDLAQMMSIGTGYGEWIEEWIPQTPSAVEWENVQDRPLADMISRKPDPSLPNAIIFRDSFSEFLRPFLAEHFQTAYFAWVRTGIERRPLYLDDPRAMIMIFADRTFRRIWPYPLPIQLLAADARFEASSHVLFSGLEVLIPDEGWEKTESGLRAGREPRGYTINLPPTLTGNRSEIPLVRTGLSLVEPVVVEFTWKPSEPGLPDHLRLRLDPGEHQVTFPIIDPDATGPFRLHIRGSRGGTVVTSFEVRLHPRD